MITVRMLGGAKKSFPSGTVILYYDRIRVSDIFDVLADHKPPGTPKMDTENMLIAINGADSSAYGGRSAIIRDGDSVDIIPVIHGGSACRFTIYDIHVLAMCIPGIEADPVHLRQRIAGVHIQSINASYILGMPHLRRILEISIEAERQDIMLAERLETDIILRLAGTTQIAKAIRQAGVVAGQNAVVVAIGNDHDLDTLYETLHDIIIPFPEQTIDNRGCFTDMKVPPGRTLEDMLVERAAVL